MKKLAALLITIAAASPASAQHFSVGGGFTFGDPGYYDAAPFYDEPPLVYAPEPPPAVFRMMPADAVFDSLEERGYRDFGPMAFRDGAYKVEATNRRGDRLALELNAVTAEVMRAFVIAESVAPPARTRRHSNAAPSPRRESVSPGGRNRSSGRDDPLVIY